MQIIKFGKYIRIVFSGLVIFSLLNSCSGETFETAINDYNDASRKPQVSSLIASNNITLSLSFDVNLDENSAKNARYSIIDQNGTPLPISSIQIGEKSVILTTDSQQNQNYTVKVSAIKSANTVEMEPYSGNFSGDALPEIVNVSSNSNDGTFYVRDEILIQVEFSEPVDVTGTTTLLMNTGVMGSTAIYTSGSGTNILTFSYIVASGDSSSNLDYSDTSSLSLNGGAIIDLQQNNAIFSLPVPGEIGSLSYNKSFSINSTEFSISDVVVNEGSGSVIVAIAKTGDSPGGTSTDYSTSDNTATAPSDYTATSGTLNWAVAETGDKTVTITVIDDSVIETDEAFTVTLSNPVNATIINSTATVTITENDFVPPVVTIGAPSPTSVNSTGSVDYPITYTGATTINLTNTDGTLNTTGTASCTTINVSNGTTANPTVTFSACTGDGTIGINITAATSSNAAGNTDTGAGPSNTFNVDNTPPIVAIGAPSTINVNSTGSVDYPITYTGATTINLTNTDGTLNTTGTASCTTINVSNGTTANPTVTFSACTGDGTIGINITAATSSDTAGNTDTGTGPSSTFNVDNTPPSTVPSPSGGRYPAASSVTLTCDDGTGSGCATIYYTTDGTTPTTASAVYSTAITTSATGVTALKFYAVDNIGNSEAVTTQMYATGNDYLLDAGMHHSVAHKKSDNTVWTWGDNSLGTLGNGDNPSIDSNTPTQVCDSGEIAPCSIFLINVAAVGSGHLFSVTLKNDGSLWTWGQNDNGQLGDNTTTQSNTPTQVTGPGGAGFLANVFAFASGSDHILAVQTDGSVWAWGNNVNGQTGDGSTTQSNTPTQVCDSGEIAPCSNFLSNVVAVAAGGSHSVALKADGTVWTWGDNTYGQLGDDNAGTNNLVPVQVCESVASYPCASFLTNVIAVATGTLHSVALKADGTVWAWGDNTYGQLGDGSTTQSNKPVQAGSLINMTAIAAEMEHTLALKSDGTAWAWGNNAYGQIGNGTRTQFPMSVFSGSNPNGLEYDPVSNTMWVADFGNNTIYNLNTNGTVISSFNGPGANPRGIAFDGANLWIADNSNPGTIYEVNTSGVVLSSFFTSDFDSGNNDSRSVAYDTSDGSLWVTDHNLTGLATIYNITTAGVLQSSFSLASDSMIQGISYDSGTDTLWLINHTSNTIYNVDTTGTIISQFLTTDYDAGAFSTRDVAFNTNAGTLWVVDEVTRKFYNITTTGSLIQTTPRSNPNGLDYDPVSNTMWVANFGNNTIYNIRADGTVISSFSSPGIKPRGIAFDGTNLWIAGTGRIYKVNTSGVPQNSFLTSGFDSGNGDTRSVAYDTSDDSLWVTDHNSAILSVVHNITTAGVSVSSFSLVGKNMIQGISYDAGTDTLWLIEHFSNTIYNVDTTGTILSQFQTTVYDANALATRDVAFDSNTGALWVVDENSGKFYNITTTGQLNLATSPSQVCATGQTYPCSTYLANIIAIGSGHRHMLALDSLNQFWSWGDNTNGQLGDNTTNDKSIPVAVPAF